jgi:hypothetical protein
VDDAFPLVGETGVRAVTALGEAGLFEVTVIVGWYQHIATQLAVFDVRPPVQP